MGSEGGEPRLLSGAAEWLPMDPGSAGTSRSSEHSIACSLTATQQGQQNPCNDARRREQRTCSLFDRTGLNPILHCLNAWGHPCDHPCACESYLGPQPSPTLHAQPSSCRHWQHSPASALRRPWSSGAPPPPLPGRCQLPAACAAVSQRRAASWLQQRRQAAALSSCRVLPPRRHGQSWGLMASCRRCGCVWWAWSAECAPVCPAFCALKPTPENSRPANMLCCSSRPPAGCTLCMTAAARCTTWASRARWVFGVAGLGWVGSNSWHPGACVFLRASSEDLDHSVCRSNGSCGS